MRTAYSVVLGSLLAVSNITAASFTNGAFESGNFSGWTQGSGYWTGGAAPNPTDYLPGGSRYNASYDASGIVTAGLDPRTDNNLNMVYSGTYSARVNDSNNNYSVSVISQTVSNYTDSNIYFAWAAVLEESHGATDSDNFILKLTNDTLGITLYEVTFNSATAPPGLFTKSSSDWYYTKWQVQNLDVSAYSGDTFTLSLLGSDCPYGGHAGYVYLDGFGSVTPPGGSDVPEPGTVGLLAAGLGLLIYKRRR